MDACQLFLAELKNDLEALEAVVEGTFVKQCLSIGVYHVTDEQIMVSTHIGLEPS